MGDLREKFKNPGVEYRPLPFWSWNDDLDEEELARQIDEMAKQGMGGYFMHARSGLTTEYLGEKWYDCIKTGIDKGKEVGLAAWIYDEEGWPSGFAGGRVTAMSPEFHAKYMALFSYQSAAVFNWDEMLAVYVYTEATGELCRTWDRTYTCAEGESLLAVRRYCQPYYIDVMYKPAVDAFLAVTHQVYYEKFGEDFGNGMGGFFTDEPRFTCNNFGELAWTDPMPEEFKRRYGYDLMEVLPLLWKPFKGYEKVRYDFWRLANDLFVTNYMKNIYDWCEVHHCRATGHIMMEETIFSQMTSSGGVMPFYEYEHIPGIDWLRRRIETPVIAKQVGSVACQLGRKQVLTESFALTGWNVTFEELRWILEWQYVNGVNLLCQHLEGYSLKGSRKRDYPPSHFIQQSWWEQFKAFTDYVGRLGAALSEGTELADVLVIHPMRSGFVCFDGTRTPEIRQLDEEFARVSTVLSSSHISYHYGDETMIAKYASVKDARFTVGAVSYRTVILPHMYAIDEVTLKLLVEFAKQGGTVLSTGAFPGYTNGCENALAQLRTMTKTVSYEELRAVMTEAGLTMISCRKADGREAEGVSYQIRRTEAGVILYLVNHSQTETYETRVLVYGTKARPQRMDADTGDFGDMDYNADRDTEFGLTFLPMQSHLIFLSPIEDTAGAVSVMREKPEIITVVPGQNWTIDSIGRNALTLDRCDCAVDGEKRFENMAAIKVMQELLDLKKACDIELTFRFDVEKLPENNREFFLAVEDAEKYIAVINGHEIVYQENGWWKDKSFKKIDIKPYVKEGENTIVLKGRFEQRQKVYDVLYGENVYETELNSLTYDMEIESIYVVGDFGVYSKSAFLNRERNAMVTDGPFVITDRPTSLFGPEFTKQGLLFFAEDMTISQTIDVTKEEGKRVILNYGRQNCQMMTIAVNGIPVKTSLWAPYEADITDAAKEGENILTIRLYASNRNLLGPHHHIKGECYNVGPESFTGKWSWVERESEAEATDIADKTINYWTDSYCFVKFGV